MAGISGRCRLAALAPSAFGQQTAPSPAPAGQRLGMHIMQALAGQLGGSLQVGGGPGTTLAVEFAHA